ncbi:hypothetical protein BDW22DRAFT_1487963 [Trametopsis cervina]|nr:hypothetical protein BDW22DRAFT_1487963 [Trametopsis cervina]
MPGEQPLIIDSRSARREFTQCQKCGKDKEHYKIKLSVCTGCHISTYCSQECQRAHWPSHKAMCIQRREATEKCAKMDQTVVDHDPILRPLPSEIVAELRSFTQKFNPALFQASINCLKLAQAGVHSNIWKEVVVMVMLNRLTDVKPDSRAWSRYTVELVVPLPIGYVVDKLAGGDHSLVQRMQEQEAHHRENGSAGSITTVMCTMCESTGQSRMIHNVTFYGFGQHSFSAVEISEDRWVDQLKETVEKMSGRTTGTSS